MEGIIKIHQIDLNKSYMNMINDLSKKELQEKFINAKPFSYIVIDNFLKDEYAEELYNNYPEINNQWHKYNNQLEVKYESAKTTLQNSINQHRVNIVDLNALIKSIASLEDEAEALYAKFSVEDINIIYKNLK